MKTTVFFTMILACVSLVLSLQLDVSARQGEAFIRGTQMERVVPREVENLLYVRSTAAGQVVSRNNLEKVQQHCHTPTCDLIVRSLLTQDSLKARADSSGSHLMPPSDVHRRRFGNGISNIGNSAGAHSEAAVSGFHNALGNLISGITGSGAVKNLKPPRAYYDDELFIRELYDMLTVV